MSLDVSGSTQYGEKFNQHNTGQDGYASGKLNEINISEKGVVYARYSNGVDVALGQVALSNFNNPQGLLAKAATCGRRPLPRARRVPARRTAPTWARSRPVRWRLPPST